MGGSQDSNGGRRYRGVYANEILLHAREGDTKILYMRRINNIWKDFKHDEKGFTSHAFLRS